jgi:starvation-inducible DNA-binding protein
MDEETEYTLEQLVQQMKVYLGSTFTAYLKAHNYHWNVEGMNFHDLHAFFSEIYTELFDSLDDTAEQIRQLGAYAPGALSRFKELSLISDELNIPDSRGMLETLTGDNAKLMEIASKTCEMADQLDYVGLENYLADRVMAHSKLNWKLKSMLA